VLRRARIDGGCTPAAAKPISVLIADIGMPDASGYNLVRRLRIGETSGARIPALAVTAYAADDDRRRALEAGFDGHLAKPITPEALIAAVQHVLSGAGIPPDPGFSDYAG
jgi:CheY-like chemotaxis protein